MELVQRIQTSPWPAWLDLNLTMPQLKMLAVVDSLEAAPMSQVAARLGIGLSAATSLIDRLEEHDLARREHDLHDRRVVRVTTTSAGRELMSTLHFASTERL